MHSTRFKYSCNTATETLQWIRAIIDFLNPYRFLLDAHVVNFFKDKLWESLDKDWMDCLRDEPVENLLLIPSGVVQVYIYIYIYILIGKMVIFLRASCFLADYC